MGSLAVGFCAPAPDQATLRVWIVGSLTAQCLLRQLAVMVTMCWLLFDDCCLLQRHHWQPQGSPYEPSRNLPPRLSWDPT